MKLTRYFQSCLLVEAGNSRILIDPSGHEGDDFDKFGKLDGVLYTHEHSDHFDPDLAQRFAGTATKLYANASTAKQMRTMPNVVNDGQEFAIGNFKLKAIELPHCLMADGAAGPQNTGYLINGMIFNPGDGKELAGLQVDVLTVPITGPDISFKDSFDFAKQVSAKKVIPLHYDVMGANPEVFKLFAGWTKMSFQINVLASGESIELEEAGV